MAACNPPAMPCCVDTFPQEKQGQAMTMFGLAALLAPVVGPTLGGYSPVAFSAGSSASGDPFLRVQTLLILFVLGLSGLIYQQLPLRNPLTLSGR